MHKQLRDLRVHASVAGPAGRRQELKAGEQPAVLDHTLTDETRQTLRGDIEFTVFIF